MKITLLKNKVLNTKKVGISVFQTLDISFKYMKITLYFLKKYK